MRRLDAVSLVEYRYRAVCEVLGSSPIGEVAVRYGTSRHVSRCARGGGAFCPKACPGWRIALNPSGSRAYVANWEASTVSVIDTASNSVVAVIPVGLNPNDVAVNWDGTRIYTSSWGANALTVIDAASNSVIGSVGVGPVSYGIALTDGVGS